MPIFIDPSLSQYIRAPSSSPVRVANPDAFLGYSSPARIQTSRPLFLSPHLSFHSLQHNSPPKTPSTTPQLTFLTPPQPVFCSSSYTSSPYWNYDSYSSWGADYTLFSPTPTQAPFLHAALQSPSPLRSAALPHVAHSTFPCLTPSAASQARSPFLSATGSACLVSDASPAELRSPSLGRPHLRRDHYSHRTPSPTPLDEDSPFIHFPQTPLQHRLARAALNTESPLTPMSTPPSTPLPFKSKLRDRAAASQLASSATPSSTHSPPSHTPIHAPPNGQHDGTAVIITERNGFAIPSATRRSTRSQARAVRVPASDGALLPISLSSQHAERALSTSDNISSSPLISKKRRYSQQSGPNKTRRAPASRTSGRGAVSSQASTASQGPPLEFKKRTFPDNLERRPQFPRFYRNFPVCSFISNDRSHDLCRQAIKPEGMFNPPGDLLNLYQPRFTKGISKNKTAMCPICAEAPDRGGEGKKVWLATKQSAYNYHMMYYHGISPVTGQPFSPPVHYRTSPHHPKSRVEKHQILEGQCHKCQSWFAVETVKKDHDTKIKEHFWWKHAALCHTDSRLEGDENVYFDDEVYRAVQERITAAAATSPPHADAIREEATL